MSYRGRGSFGRGRGGRGAPPGKPYELFPDIEVPVRKCVVDEENLRKLNSRLKSFWRSSPYFIKDIENNKSGCPYIERYSDMINKKDKPKSDDIWQYMKRTNISFTSELIKDGRRSTRPLKKARWNLDEDMKKFDLFEKLNKISEQVEAEVEKDKKDGESEEEGDKDIAEEEEEFSDDGDYNQNEDFDDDDDGLNMEEDHEIEPTY